MRKIVAVMHDRKGGTTSTKSALFKHANPMPPMDHSMPFNFGKLQKRFENGTYVVRSLKKKSFCPFLAVQIFPMDYRGYYFIVFLLLLILSGFAACEKVAQCSWHLRNVLPYRRKTY
jgi:hypothetical protein